MLLTGDRKIRTDYQKIMTIDNEEDGVSVGVTAYQIFDSSPVTVDMEINSNSIHETGRTKSHSLDHSSSVTIQLEQFECVQFCCCVA